MEKKKKALLIIDLQNGVCYQEQPLHHLNELLKRVNQRIKSYREAGRPIIFVQHNDEDLVQGTKTWQLHPDLQALPATDYFVQKIHANSFYHTNLQEILQKEQVNELEIWGAQTEYCMDTTIKFAHGLDYKVFIESGSSSTVDNDFMSAEKTIAFYEKIWQGRFATITASNKYK